MNRQIRTLKSKGQEFRNAVGSRAVVPALGEELVGGFRERVQGCLGRD